MYKVPDIYLYMSTWNSHVNLRQAGKDEPEPGYHYGPAIREFYLVHVVTSGRGTYTARGVEYAVKAGDAFLILPNEITVYTADKQDPWRYHFFSFSGDMAEMLVPIMGFSPKRLVIPGPGPEVIPLIEESIQSIQKPSPADRILSLAQLFRIVSCFTNSNPQATAEEAQTNPYVKKAIAYIEVHYTENITVNDLATALAIDRSYLYRIFKNDTNMSPKEYLDSYRINVARQLLEESNLSISQISQAAGFASFSSFYRFFVREYGCSPREYLLSDRNKEEQETERDNK